MCGSTGLAETQYNRGNALLVQGADDEAIAAYDQALAEQPDWVMAVENRALAQARKQRLAPPEADADGTGDMLAADEILFRDSGRTERAKSEQVVEGDTPAGPTPRCANPGCCAGWRPGRPIFCLT
jgi:Ca-activated chloride channel family protein